jgi:acyl transferase domain-containing protein
MNNELDIAVVGMAGRFPGARNLEEFWHNLVEGVESITRFSDEELLRSGVPAGCLSNPNYVKAAPILEDPSQFDADFFGFLPIEARTLDPQHRILLELAHEAIEDAGYDPNRYPGRIGVFTGAAFNTYFMDSGLSRDFAQEYIPTLISSDKDFLSTRISYKLNLKGPSLTIQTACSTSMVAVHLARQSLLNEESDMALAGAVSVRVPHQAGYFCDGGGVVSPDGHVRAFDAKANGTVFGSGGGILVLKRLADALADGDNIHAVIKGSAVNNDGSEKAGYTTPSVNGQADVTVEALANAGVEADSITYLEAHGSGTPVGDPVEIRALNKAFRTFTQRSGYCAIGSVKTNVGHLDAAAAVAGMIKTILALKHRTLPPSLHFNQANPEIDFKSTPFYVNAQLQKWTSDGPRRAGVMSTGMGGTNAHLVFEEAPELQQSSRKGSSHLLILSARSPAALDHATHRLREFLKHNDSINMNDVAHTLCVGRRTFSHRRCLVSSSREDAISALTEENSKRVLSRVKDESAARPVVFMFPGIGDHYVGMGHGLYEEWEVFRHEVDRCAQILHPYLGTDIRKMIYPDGHGSRSEGKSKGIDLKKMLGRSTDAPKDQHATDLNKTLFAQPALFTVEYALARLWQSFGITPAAMAGHSMGEYVAACLAGVLPLEDALRLIATRARLVNDLPQGAMLAVTLSEKELLPLLSGDLSISLINGPALCVVAGPAAAVAEFERRLNEKQIISRRVQNAHAFHSRMLSPMVSSFEKEVRKVRLTEPGIPYISNVTGRWITGRDATNPSYWAMHADHTARFGDALQELWRLKNPILLEAGPGRTLGVLAMQHPDRQNSEDPLTISSIPHHYENQSDVEFLLQGIGRLWLSGVEIRWESMYPGERRRRVSLPTYPYERQSYWIENTPGSTNIVPKQKSVSATSSLDDWFYTPTWKRTHFPIDIVDASLQQPAFWLIVADRHGGGARLKSKLEAAGMSAAFVRFGKKSDRHSDGSFDLNPSCIESYRELFLDLERRTAGAPINIVHLGSLVREDEAAEASSSNQNFGFFSLFHIAQAIGELRTSIPIKIGIISNRLHSVTGEEDVAPAMATVLGPCGVIPKEYPNIKCFSIDLSDSHPIDSLPDELLARIISEFAEEHASPVIAYRGKYRWERHLEQVRLKEPLPSSVVSEPTAIRRLKRRGVYLITGGTGGIGLAIAEYLAKAYRPRLVLTKKSPFPKKSTWIKLVAAPETPAPVLKTITALMEIERMGAEIDVLVADASDREQMQASVDEVLARYGTINGVIHAAGIVRAGLIQAKTRETADSVLAPKVYGTMVLFDLLKKVKPDFLVVFSSITSILTPYAESDYSAANCFLDAFSCFANAHGGFHTLAINWPGWREVGQLADLATLPGLEGWKRAALERAIMTKDGLEAFKRAINSDLTQVIVSPENLEHLLKSEAVFDPIEYLSQVQPEERSDRPPESEQDGAGYTNTVETALAEIWTSVFGLERVGIHDHFIDLGGHSLLAMQIVSRIHSLYQIPFTFIDFFDGSTIAQISSVIQARILAKSEGLTDEQARRLISMD